MLFNKVHIEISRTIIEQKYDLIYWTTSWGFSSLNELNRVSDEY